MPLVASAMLLAATLATVIECALLQRKYGLFTGGFLQPDALLGWNRAAFVVLSVLLDLAAVAPFVAIAYWLARTRTRLRPAQRIFVAALLGVAPLEVAVFARFQVIRYFGDKIEYSTLRAIGAGSTLEMLAQASAHLVSLGVPLATWGLVLVVGTWALARVDIRLLPVAASYRWEWRPATALVLGLMVVGPAASLVASGAATPVPRQLRHKVAGRWALAAGAWLTDFDRDGYGMVGRPQDFAPLDGQRYPFAVDWPDNGIDEDGIGGDLRDVAIAPGEPVGPVLRTPDVVLIVLESYRFDNVGARVGGAEVTPVMDGLIESGATLLEGYSHSGFTIPSLTALFRGAMDSSFDGTMFQDFNDAGYTTAVVSGGDDSFGGINQQSGMNTADHYIDARNDVGSRASAFTTPGSLTVPWTVVTSNVATLLNEVPGDEPLFLYVNLTDCHFPYTSYALERRVDVDPIPQSDISPENAEWVQQTYRNAAANVDHAVGLILESFRRQRGHEPAFLIVGDHGESLFEEGVLGHGFQASQAQLRVPVVTRGLVSRVTSPMGLSEIRGVLRAGLREPAPRVTEVVTEPGKWVFLYVPSLERPAFIGAAGAGGLAWFNLGDGTRGASGVPPAAVARDPLVLVRTWERLRVEQAMAGR